jgi:hypothetical protein
MKERASAMKKSKTIERNIYPVSNKEIKSLLDSLFEEESRGGVKGWEEGKSRR